MRRLCIMLRCSLIRVQVSALKGKTSGSHVSGNPRQLGLISRNPPSPRRCMRFYKGVFASVLLAILLSIPPAEAAGVCESGEICALQSEAFGCKDAGPIKRWVDLYVEESRE